MECEPDIDYTVDGRILTFNKNYPQGTRITFHYVFQTETTTAFEDAWFGLRDSNPRHYLYGAGFGIRADNESLKFMAAGFSMKDEPDVRNFISGGFSLRDTATARFVNADFGAHETEKASLSGAEFSLRT
jgi:hypothetical protein